MYFWIIGILVILPMESIASLFGPDSDDSPSPPDTPRREYRNNIGVVCAYNSSNRDHYFSTEIGDQRYAFFKYNLEKFGKGRNVIFSITGYDENDNYNYAFESEWFKTFTYGLLKDEKTIACSFDFNRLEEMGPGCLSAYSRNTVGKRLSLAAEIITRAAADMFAKDVFTTFEDFELIGFSLGAHVAGLTARRIKKKMRKEVPRIFALDPPRRPRRSHKQIQKTDAGYIQAIFTSTIGQQNLDVHCKVFINRGANQPGCEKMIATAQPFCNHKYATDIYEQIAQQKLALIAYKDPKENVGVPNVPNEMTVGHHSRDNKCGVFNANTDYSKVKKARNT